MPKAIEKKLFLGSVLRKDEKEKVDLLQEMKSWPLRLGVKHY